MTRTTWTLLLALGAWGAAGCSASSGTSGGGGGGHGADASLSALVITSDAGEALFSPAFASDVHTYSALVRQRSTTLTVTATATDPKVRSIVVQPLGGTAVPLTSGVAGALDLPATGVATRFRVVVTAADGVSTSGYTIELTRRAEWSVATLASLTDSAKALAFASGTTTYTYQVPQVLSAGYTITPTLTDPLASMTINGSAAASGVARAVDLTSGAATVVIVVTADDAKTQITYTLNVSLSHVVPTSSIAVAGAGGATVLGGAGTTLQLTATASPAGAPQAFTWTTSNAAVATVSSSGLVTAQGAGEVIITAHATDSSGITGSLTLVAGGGTMYVVKQANGTATATLSGGTITVAATYGSSGNAFKYVAPNYYGTNSNGFVSLPFPLSGDFSLTASVSITSTPKANTACGIGLGVTTGWTATDKYAYAVLPTSGGAGVAKYVNSAGNVTNVTAPPTIAFAIPTTAPVVITFSRTGSSYTLGFTGTGGTTITVPASTLTDGSTAFGTGPVYPALSFNNISATVTGLVVRDGAGNAIFDSSTGTIQTYVPASLTLSASTATIVRGQSATVTATAVAGGGATASVTAVAADPTVVSAAVSNGAPSSTITLSGLKAGSTTVTVTNAADGNAATSTKTIAVTVEDFSATDGYGSIAGRTYPAAGATAAYADGELSLTFDSPPTLNAGGSISIFNYADGSVVDRILFAGEAQPLTSYAGSSPATVTVNVGTQLARVSGNTLYFTPHFGKLAYGTTYYVGISTTAVTGTLNATTFTGLSNLKGVATWRFTTRAAPTLGTTLSVDGSQAQTTADFRTLGGALMALAAAPVSGATGVTINVAAGTYTELLSYRAKADPNLTITIRGPAGNVRGDSAVVQYVNGNAMNGATNTRPSFYFAGAHLVLENLTFKNTGARSTVNQAETLYFDSRTGYNLAVHNCSFSSNQDTLQISGRAWFYDTYIEGNTDFIWGTADAALFENCDLRVIPDASSATQTTYSIFVARTGTTGAATLGKGFVLLNSRVNVSDGLVVAYGRDAGTGSFYDQVALINNVFSTPGVGTTPGQLATGLWVNSTAPLSLGDSSYVGWKSSGNTGLTADQSPVAGTTLTIASQSSEYDTRDHILNRVVTVSGGTPTGFAAAATSFATSALATTWGAPNP